MPLLVSHILQLCALLLPFALTTPTPPSLSSQWTSFEASLNITLSSSAKDLTAPPPPGFHIDGSSYVLPHPYRISFEHYSAPILSSLASPCLHKAAVEYHNHIESDPMGPRQRVYEYGGVVLGIKPDQGLTWGYWGAAIRAIDSMWKSWDVVGLEFVIGVQEVGVVGRGFLKGVDGVE
ncbi:hypothetical protein ACLMJK_009368 [Lecanora helva]